MIKARINNEEYNVVCNGKLKECVEDLIDLAEGIIDALADDDSDMASRIASCVTAAMIEDYEVDTDKCKSILKLIKSEVLHGGC